MAENEKAAVPADPVKVLGCIAVDVTLATFTFEELVAAFALWEADNKAGHCGGPSDPRRNAVGLLDYIELVQAQRAKASFELPEGAGAVLDGEGPAKLYDPRLDDPHETNPLTAGARVKLCGAAYDDPSLTVLAVGESGYTGQAKCGWFNRAGELEYTYFPITALKRC